MVNCDAQSNGVIYRSGNIIQLTANIIYPQWADTIVCAQTPWIPANDIVGVAVNISTMSEFCTVVWDTKGQVVIHGATTTARYRLGLSAITVG